MNPLSHFSMLLAQADATTPAATPDAAPKEGGFGNLEHQVSALWKDLQHLAVQYGLSVLGALVILIVAWILSRWAQRTIRRALDRAKFDPTVSKFVGHVTRWAILVLALVTCLAVIGVNITALATVLGASGLAIGLASQGALSNLAAGLMLLVTRPFRVGDVIVVDGFLGIVEEIELFATKLNTPDNRRIIMPNNSVFGKVIENITFNPNRRVDIVVGVAYSTDLDAAKASIERSLAGSALVLKEPPPMIVLREFGESSINFDVRAWAPTKDFALAKHDVIKVIKAGFDRDDIEIPFPQRVVWMQRTGNGEASPLA
ncbi:MAG: mechanosensitive ion channel family protein [Phycisphaeraceae bacterium]|nr:mechanosensitive ion channel family protein [Phycisphaeraceae bacterium]